LTGRDLEELRCTGEVIAVRDEAAAIGTLGARSTAANTYFARGDAFLVPLSGTVDIRPGHAQVRNRNRHRPAPGAHS
jgi:hypothetical protein